MDDFALAYLANSDEPAVQEEDERDDQPSQDAHHEPEPEPESSAASSGPKSRLKRRGIQLGIFKAAHMQDKLLEK